MKSISEIKNEFSVYPIDRIEELIPQYEEDTRKGVQNIIQSYRKKQDAYIKELKRLDEISTFEEKYYAMGCEYIAGIDEVGRGPLAGPVVTCAVILPKGFKYEGINDSKKLSEEKRNFLCEVIKKEAVAYAVGIVDVKTIDEINILNATKLAMVKAIDGLQVKPDAVLIDAVTLDIPYRQEAIIKGDERSISIAAASIVAKVTRDEMMKQYHEAFPAYDFKSNKGYGSRTHLEAIDACGICPLHRRSFLENILNRKMG